MGDLNLVDGASVKLSEYLRARSAGNVFLIKHSKRKELELIQFLSFPKMGQRGRGKLGSYSMMMFFSRRRFRLFNESIFE